MQNQPFLKSGQTNFIRILTLFLLCWSCTNFGCLAQDPSMDDAGADTTGSEATEDMMDSDPGTINPQNKQGYGQDIATSTSDMPDPQNEGKKNKGSNAKDKGKTSEKSIADQTVQAAMQLGVLVGVALMVGVLFFVQLGADLFYSMVTEKFAAKFNKHREPDIEERDPASLVGTFKRYK